MKTSTPAYLLSSILVFGVLTSCHKTEISPNNISLPWAQYSTSYIINYLEKQQVDTIYWTHLMTDTQENIMSLSQYPERFIKGGFYLFKYKSSEAVYHLNETEWFTWMAHPKETNYAVSQGFPSLSDYSHNHYYYAPGAYEKGFTERYQAVIRSNGDTNFKRLAGYGSNYLAEAGGRTVFLDQVIKISVYSDADYTADRPAGTDISDCFIIRYQDPYKVVENTKNFEPVDNNPYYWTEHFDLSSYKHCFWLFTIASYDAQSKRYIFNQNHCGIPNSNWFDCEYYTRAQECRLSDLDPASLRYFPSEVNVRLSVPPDIESDHRFTVVYEFADGRIMQSPPRKKMRISPN